MENQELYRLAGVVGKVLRREARKLAVAESCTGGWVAQCITDVPGSSAWFDCGFVTYSNESKCAVLGVDRKIIDGFGAVSEETVKAMAAGVLNNSLADTVVAISGIAGPAGGTVEKPVGTVWFAWQCRGGEPQVMQCRFDGDRRAVRWQAVQVALRGILDVVGRE
jgi:nicotinamide-nucleotide amidase